MSFVSWHNYGYGICTDEIQIGSVERIEALLELAPLYRAEIHSWLEECEIKEPTVDDYLEFDQDYELGITTILSEVILEAEGIGFTACNDFNSCNYLIYTPSYPWTLPDKERGLTEKGVGKILQRYVGIVSDTMPDIDYQSVENGG